MLLLFACADPPPPPPAPVDLTDPAALEDRRKALKEDVRKLIHDLGKAGKYDCCIVVPCEMCAMRMGGCACGEGLRMGRPVCEECAVMWMSGQGDEPGVDPTTVRSFLQAAKEEKEKAEGGGCNCPAHAGEEKQAP